MSSTAASIRTMSPTDAAYVAGLLDGEGTITVPGGARLQITPIVTIVMTDRALIEWVRDTVGGRVRTQPKAERHHRSIWQWTVYGDQAVAVLAQIQPYLRLKLHQASLAVCLGVRRRLNVGRRGLSAEERFYRGALIDALRHLNRRGIREAV